MLTGTVYQIDGKTPAKDVIIYYWHTDKDGYYAVHPDLDVRAQWHGHLRGWVKTNESGQYAIFTSRPAPYPNDESPAHIHLAIKEPDLANEYYIDEINFEDDKLLIPYLKKHKQENRGGSGFIPILLKNRLKTTEHDIILGLNIPNYPKEK